MKDTYLYFAENLGADAAGDSCMYPAFGFTGAIPNGVTTGRLSFKALTGNAADDIVEINITSGKFKTFCQELAKALNSNKSEMIVFADEDNAIYFEDNAAGMSVLNITLDT